MDVFDGIYTRRSVRKYKDESVAPEDIITIIKAGTWAPSGLNNQPWRFVIVRERNLRFELAGLTNARKIIEDAPVSIAVFADRNAMYDNLKDHQAMGACIQNMLLAAHALNLGAVWLGEILNNADRVALLLEVPDTLELMAVVAVGHPADRSQVSRRKDIPEVLLKEF